MFGGPDKDVETEPMYGTVDLEDVAARAEAAETAAGPVSRRRLVAEARVVTEPEDYAGDGEIIDADADERDRELRADGGRPRCPSCDERSSKCYRCSECGYDLASKDASAGRSE